MLNLRKFLKDLFNPAAASPAPELKIEPKPISLEERFENILKRIELRGAKDLTHLQICKVQQFIMSTTMQTALTENKVIKDKKGQIIGFTAESFTREMKVLETLGKSTEFSTELHSWVNDRLNAMTRRLSRKENYQTMNARWNNLEEKGRIAFLNNIVALQLEIFNDEHLKLKPARLELQEMDPNRGGTFYFEGNGLHKGGKPVILINSILLKDSSVDCMLRTIVHEQMHSIVRQLATAFHSGALAKTHPLYRDGEMMHERVSYNAYIPSIYGPGYWADVEERLCINLDKRFIPSLRQQSATMKNRIERPYQ